MVLTLHIACKTRFSSRAALLFKMLVHHMILLLPGLTHYLGGFRSFFFAFVLLFESTISIFKIISLWRFCLSVKNEITEFIACWNPKVLKYNNLLTQIDFTHRHFEHKTEQIYLKVFVLKNIWKFSSWKTCRNVYFTCFHLKKYRLKSYPILVMSLSRSPRSESYPIYNLCRNNAW